MQIPKILIVDDEPFNVDFLQQELEDSDYLTISAGNGQEALDKVLSESPDLILLDIMMPILDGFEVLTRLKEDPHTRDIPVIIISASNDLKSVIKGIELGADDYLPKPFEATLLNARISSSLEKKRFHDLQNLYTQSLERELEIGSEIQRGFLPSELPQVKGWEIGVFFRSAREVAGDFYDTFLLPDGNLACVIGDVCGKGVGAALFMTLFRSLIRASATSEHLVNFNNQHQLKPAELLQHIVSFTNHYVAETHADASMFATVFIGIIDVDTGTLYYLNCGNDPALLIRQGTVIANMPPSGPAIGVILEPKFRVEEIIMQENDLLVAFTDGIPDTLNIKNEPFGTDRLIKLLHGNNATLNSMLENIEAQISLHIGKAEQFDDISLLVVKKH